MKNSINFKVIYLETNQGHGNARRIGLDNCSNELVALMDADDISLPNRFYYQLNKFKEDSRVDVVGGQITEFIGEPNNVIGKRVVPLKHIKIKSYLKKRCPMNQVSVMFKKESVQSAGGYLDWYCEEDYYLWIRMFLKGFIFANVPETLVNVRIGNEMSSRRGGKKYFQSEKKLQKFLLRNKLIGRFRYFYNVVIRFCGEVLISNKIRTKLFRLLRKKSTKENNSCNDLIFPLENKPFSVSMCVYNGDNENNFDDAISSIINQSCPPNEIVLVVDGQINDKIQLVIDKWEVKLNYEKNF